MTREEYKTMIDEKLKAVKQELMAEFKEEEPSLDGWKVGDKYYSHDTIGNIIASRVDSTNNGSDINSTDTIRIKHGYVKHTEEEVKFQFERDAVLYELSKFAEPEDKAWDDINLFHYYIQYDNLKKRIAINWNRYCKSNNIYFASREDAEKAIQAVGEERIKRFYLGVEE